MAAITAENNKNQGVGNHAFWFVRQGYMIIRFIMLIYVGAGVPDRPKTTQPPFVILNEVKNLCPVQNLKSRILRTRVLRMTVLWFCHRGGRPDRPKTTKLPCCHSERSEESLNCSIIKFNILKKVKYITIKAFTIKLQFSHFYSL